MDGPKAWNDISHEKAAPGLDVPLNTFELLLTWLVQILMVFGGVVPYIPQYQVIKSTENAEGFSLYVCLSLLVANILRIIFWFGHPFEVPLLLQSIFMIMAMLAMVQLCVNVKHSAIIIREEHSLADFDPNYFWKWTDFRSYLQCTAYFAAFCSILMYIFQAASIFVEVVGFSALFIEALLGVPQFLRNYHNQSTHGMRFDPTICPLYTLQNIFHFYSQKMVLFWTVGDIFKTTYFILRKTPVQFIICGILQFSVDIAVWFQVWWYRARKRHL
ncbi:unnamed protein product [Darwinula stevensoni]|uniref:Solute carrier family 66 member 2 n=1 Tax=Darwinula stevensoni TaxID=69355 RepID=A0A7R8ZX72_9CRUS|nr:unnamed protein product [Darwinula stevensoni]CAG0878841.1 unnamed protein product [Darwinula stevensoni]